MGEQYKQGTWAWIQMVKKNIREQNANRTEVDTDHAHTNKKHAKH